MKDFTVLEGYAPSEFEEIESEWELKHAIFEQPLAAVPRRATLVVSVASSVADVIRAMNEQHSGCALVVQGGRLAGIFTERDVLRKVAGSTIDVRKTSVADVMTSDPDTLPASASIAFALRKMMEEGYRHLPLVDASGCPEGVIAVRDIVAWMVSLFPETVQNLPPEPGYPRELDGG